MAAPAQSLRLNVTRRKQPWHLTAAGAVGFLGLVAAVTGVFDSEVRTLLLPALIPTTGCASPTTTRASWSARLTEFSMRCPANDPVGLFDELPR